jgi:phosphopentomutase
LFDDAKLQKKIETTKKNRKKLIALYNFLTFDNKNGHRSNPVPSDNNKNNKKLK